MKKLAMLQRGFTLIELLVVIAIIGILAAVVIGSLNDARSGGQDASIKQSVANIRSQAELVYNDGGYSYANVCTDARVTDLINAAISVVNGVAYASSTHGLPAAQPSNGTTNAARIAACHSQDTDYVVVTPLTNGVDAATGPYWCVDSTGASKEVDVRLASGAFICP